jgi:hypothetical protein
LEQTRNKNRKEPVTRGPESVHLKMGDLEETNSGKRGNAIGQDLTSIPSHLTPAEAANYVPFILKALEASEDSERRGNCDAGLSSDKQARQGNVGFGFNFTPVVHPRLPS